MIAALHVHVAFDVGQDHPVEEGEYDEALYRVAGARLSRLEAGLRDSVTEHLGLEFDVRVALARARSVEIVATILLVGSLVASYNTVRQGLLNLREDGKWLVHRVIGPAVGFPIAVDAYYQLGPAMSLLPVGGGPALGMSSSGVVAARRRELPVPRQLLGVACGLLFLILLGWLVVPLLLVAGVL